MDSADLYSSSSVNGSLAPILPFTTAWKTTAKFIAASLFLTRAACCYCAALLPCFLAFLDCFPDLLALVADIVLEVAVSSSALTSLLTLLCFLEAAFVLMDVAIAATGETLLSF